MSHEKVSGCDLVVSGRAHKLLIKKWNPKKRILKTRRKKRIPVKRFVVWFLHDWSPSPSFLVQLESGSDSDDEEPKLKYQRLGATVIEILKKDVASALAVHDRFLVGSRSSILFIVQSTHLWSTELTLRTHSLFCVRRTTRTPCTCIRSRAQHERSFINSVAHVTRAHTHARTRTRAPRTPHTWHLLLSVKDMFVFC